MENILGHPDLLKSSKVKERVREAKEYKQIKLGLSGDRLLVRYGGGYSDMVEFLDRKGFLPRYS